MTIPESQLQAWANQGAITTAKDTHEAVRRALEEFGGWPDGATYEVYLQGSYKNSTNIRGDSDVDVVAELTSAFRHDDSGLSDLEKSEFAKSYPRKSTYWYPEFRRDVQRALDARFGNIESGTNSIKVPQAPGRLRCDVVPCIQFRNYTRHSAKGDESFREGMTFETRTFLGLEDNWVVNYPKLHYKNGVTKNDDRNTRGWYKSVVRLLKNARSYLVDRDRLDRDTAPSYFLECLAYNIPNPQFGGSLQDSCRKALTWLQNANMDKFVCQNEQFYLFGDSSVQWSQRRARKLVEALIHLWNNWS